MSLIMTSMFDDQVRWDILPSSKPPKAFPMSSRTDLRRFPRPKPAHAADIQRKFSGQTTVSCYQSKI